MKKTAVLATQTGPVLPNGTSRWQAFWIHYPSGPGVRREVNTGWESNTNGRRLLGDVKKLDPLSLLFGTTRNILWGKDTAFLDINIPGAHSAKKGHIWETLALWNVPLNLILSSQVSKGVQTWNHLVITTNPQGTQMSQSCRFGICCFAVTPVTSVYSVVYMGWQNLGSNFPCYTYCLILGILERYLINAIFIVWLPRRKNPQNNVAVRSRVQSKSQCQKKKEKKGKKGI